MPLGKKGESLLRKFIREYGAKGKGYFYGKEQKEGRWWMK
jgi:hypothetical protein